MDEKDVHEAYRTYRNAAVVFATTVVAASGAVIVHLQDDLLRGSVIAFLLAIALLTAAIFGLHVQYCNIMGSTHFARWFYERFAENCKADTERRISDNWFGKLDRSAKCTFRALVVAVTVAIFVSTSAILMQPVRGEVMKLSVYKWFHIAGASLVFLSILCALLADRYNSRVMGEAGLGVAVLSPDEGTPEFKERQILRSQADRLFKAGIALATLGLIVQTCATLLEPE